MALLEAMAAGVPVVASRVGGNTELVTDGINGLLLPPEDVDGLACTLSRLVADALLRERLAAAGGALIERKFDRAVMARAYVDIFEQAMADTRSAGGAQRMRVPPAAAEIDR